MAPKDPGDRELELLRWVARRGPVTVGEATEGYGGERSLSRSTVQTMLERLYAKGHLDRRRTRGVYRYASRLPDRELLRRQVGRFVERALGGSLSPFVAYLAQAEELSVEDVAELEKILDRLQEGGRQR